MRYLVFLLLPILVACNHNPAISVERVEVLKRITVPAELLQLCPQLVTMGSSKLDDILVEDLQFIEAYGECRLRHSKLVDSIQEVLK